MRKPILFPYFGGKYRLASKLIPMFPNHTCYVEVFGGAGNVLIQKKPAKVEVFNDINSDIVNLFRVLREDFDEFHRLVRLIPHSREEFDSMKEAYQDEVCLVRRASMWYTILYQSFGSQERINSSGRCNATWAFSKKVSRAHAFKNAVDKLPLIVDRLREVHIENQDFEYILDTYDDPDSFFYLDPPYLPETRRSGGYKKEMTYQDHERLIAILEHIEGKVMLSGYANQLYDSLGWKREDFITTSWAAGRTKASGLQGEGNVKQNQKRIESVYLNYESTENT